LYGLKPTSAEASTGVPSAIKLVSVFYSGDHVGGLFKLYHK